MTNLGKKYHSRGGRPPRLYEALKLAHKALSGQVELTELDRIFIGATVQYEEARKVRREERLLKAKKAERKAARQAARLRAKEAATTEVTVLEGV